MYDGDYFGMPAVEAARLCDKAPADGILVSPATKLLAGRVEGVRFESVGKLELKGIPEPMQAFSVLWEPLDPEQAGGDVGRWPLPETLRVVPRMAYVGRSAERDLLERALGLARSAARHVVLLSGEPGIGKTRLASYSALGANADGFAVVWGGCSDDLAMPYEPWIAVCEQLVEHAPQAVLEGYAERYGGEVGRLARNLRRRVPDARAPQSSDPETERFLVFQAVAELLRAIALAVPLLVVLDDFHWADAQSVALLKHVARSVERAALAVVVTYRDTDLGKDDPLTGVLAHLRRLEGVERIELQGLAVEDVVAMAVATVGQDLDAEGVALAGEIASETGGNPFFVGEILRNLSESGMVVFDKERGRWMIDRDAGMALPESVREVVERRVAVLGWEAALGRLYCFSDRGPEGAEILARAAAQRFENVPYNPVWMSALACHAETAARTGSVEAAAMLYELLDPYSDQFVHAGMATAPPNGHVRMFLALLAATMGRHEQADAHFAFACNFHHEHRTRSCEARSELGWAEALAGRGETERAREHAARALELARHHGYGALEPRAAAILASHATVES